MTQPTSDITEDYLQAVVTALQAAGVTVHHIDATLPDHADLILTPMDTIEDCTALGWRPFAGWTLVEYADGQPICSPQRLDLPVLADPADVARKVAKRCGIATPVDRPLLADPARVAFVRRLLAAGWYRNTVTEMADGSVERVMLRPHLAATPDVIVAHTYPGGRTDLTLRDLSAEQVIAAITAVHLTPTGGPTQVPANPAGRPEYRIDFGRIGRHDRPAGLTVPAPTDADDLAERVQRYAAHLCGLDAVDVDVDLDLTTGRVTIADEYGPLGHGWVAGPGVSRTATSAPVDADAELRAGYAAQLRQIADAIERLNLPLGHRSRLHLGVVDSQADLDRWADYLGATVQASHVYKDGTVIPYALQEIPVDAARPDGPYLDLMVQSPAEPAKG